MKGHTLKCPNCGQSTYIFYMSEGEAQTLTRGESVEKQRQGKGRDQNFFEVIEETVRLVKELKTK